MAMRVAYCCPYCQTTVSFDFGQKQEWICPSCERPVSIPDPGEPDADTFRVFDGDPPAVRSSPSHYHDD